MTQSELMAALAVKLKALNGHDYTVTYTPLKNLSEQKRKEIFRFIKPNGFHVEYITRGTPLSVHEILIAHVGIIGNGDDAIVAQNQDEMEAILKSLWRNPIEGTIPVGAESGPIFDQPIDGESLEGDVRLMTACVVLTIKC